jgi:hypothetical protein
MSEQVDTREKYIKNTIEEVREALRCAKIFLEEDPPDVYEAIEAIRVAKSMTYYL